MPRSLTHLTDARASVFACLAALSAALAISGCKMGGKAPDEVLGNVVNIGGRTKSGALTERQMQAMLMAFADRFVSRVEEATNRIQAQTSDPVLRHRAQAAKYYTALAVITIAADTEPMAGLLDMAAMVTLQVDVWRNDWARETFGEEIGQPLLTCGPVLERDIWAIVDNVLDAEQQQALRDLVAGWREEHPNDTYVAMVRFDDFMLLRGERPQRSRTLLELNLVVSGADEAARQMRQTRILGERAMYLVARMPLLTAWQTELLAYELALAPEVRQSLANFDALTSVAQEFSTHVETLPANLAAEAERTLQMVDERQDRLSALVNDVRAGMSDAEALATTVNQSTAGVRDVVEETRQTAAALEQLVHSTDEFIARFQTDPTSSTRPDTRPFDINEYTRAIVSLGDTARELNTLAQEANTLLDSPALDDRVQELNGVAAARLDQLDAQASRWIIGLEERAQSLSHRVFIRGIWLIGIGCAAALATALLFRAITRAGTAR